MSLTDKAKTAKPTKQGPLCDVQKAAEQLPPEEAKALAYLIYDRRDLSTTVVSRLLREEGLTIGTHTIGRHRRGNCASCNRR